jgi:hypothetical protein
MRAVNTLACGALLGTLLSGCSHFTRHSQQAQAPPLQTGQGEIEAQQKKDQAPPPTHLPPSAAQSAPPQLPPPPTRKVKKSRRKPAKPAETATQTASTQSSPPAPAPPATTPATSPIGQLTTGDSASGVQTKHETATLIHDTLQGLTGIKRTLSADEQVTATQIRTFLQQAQQALDNGDTDGAHTLATKAKLLLDELTKQ